MNCHHSPSPGEITSPPPFCLRPYMLLLLFVLHVLRISISIFFQDVDPHRSGQQNTIKRSCLNILDIVTPFIMLSSPMRDPTTTTTHPKNWVRNPGKLWSWPNAAKRIGDFSWFPLLFWLEGQICSLITEILLTTLIFSIFPFPVLVLIF